MNEGQVIAGIILGMIILLGLILRLKFPAFLALLISAITVGVVAGMDPEVIMDSIQKGMGSTLGFVATVVGLGAMFGAILEYSGGAGSIAAFLLKKTGHQKAPLAMAITGFLVAIPVFFDVAFILLVPMIYALQKKTGKSLLLFAIPLLSGLVITHAFIPPTPGPIAVADIIGADLGWVILVGVLAGIPTALISGLWFGKFIGNKLFIAAPDRDPQETENNKLPSAHHILWIMLVPILLILLRTFSQSGLFPINFEIINLIGHPFSALIIANLIAWYFLGIKKGLDKEKLLSITTRSMAPAGSIILITGAGGAFKQMLVDTGGGEMIAASLTSLGVPLMVFAFLIAVIVRLLQGSATVAMITAASLVAPLLNTSISSFSLACLVVAIAAGASTTSHVNDSGFWLVNQYLGLTEKQTFRSWTAMTTLLALCGFLSVYLLNVIISG